MPEETSDRIEHQSNVLFCSRIPDGALKDFVYDYWLYENYVPRFHSRERILPSGTIELVINLHDDELRIYDAAGNDSCKRFSGALVSGTYGRTFITDTAEERSVMGVHFKPGGAFPFLGIAPDELVDAHVDLEMLWGRSARDLRERLCVAATPAERLDILEQTLSAHLFRPLEHHAAVATALDEFRSPLRRLTVRGMAKEVGLSQRRFIRAFAAEVGLTPKLFGRVQRFQKAISLVSVSSATPDWAQVALNCGYFDQSHLIRDFVEFSGFTPGEYFGQLRHLDHHKVQRKRNHVPLVCQ